VGIRAAQPSRIRGGRIARMSEVRVPFIGRQRELRQLDAAIDQAVEGQLTIVLVEGEAGIGKTRLIREFARRTSSRCRHYYAQASNIDRATPFHLWRPVLTQLADHSADSLVPPWRGTLARLIPILGPASEPHSEANPADERLKLFEAVSRLFEGLGPGPIAVGLDDLQWADDSSLQLLSYLARSFSGRPMVFMGTVRPEEISADLLDLYVMLEQRGLVSRISLPRLTADEVEQMVASQTDQPETYRLGRELYDRSAGNPLFANELLKIYEEAGVWPPEIETISPPELYGQPVTAAFRQLVDWRMAQLDDVSRHIVMVGATLGGSWNLRLLTRASGLEQEVVKTAAAELTARKLFVAMSDKQGHLAIPHERITEVALDSLTLSRQQLLSQWAGETWEELIGESDQRLSSERMAHYFGRAGDHTKALHYTRQAADLAIAMSAATEAIIHCYQLLALAPADDLYLLI